MQHRAWVVKGIDCGVNFLCVFAVEDYIILSGQHITEALRQRQGDYVDNLMDIPTEYMHVRATVLEPATDKETRELAAGDAQAVQMAVQMVTIPQFAALLLGCSHVLEKKDRLGMAWRKSGWARDVKLVCSNNCV